MALKRQLTRAVDWIDDRLAAATLARRRERPALLAFLFHAVFADAPEVARDIVWPAQPLLADELGRFIEHYQAHGYRFVRPDDILAGLEPDGYYALLTFDDGYANNRRALPILRRLAVPATFFVSAQHVADGRAFWWDVVYRERRRRGVAFESIRRELHGLRQRTPEAIDAWLRASFGAASTQPVGDTDRPFTPDELRAFAADPLVSIGNHTRTHADLPHQDDARVLAEIRGGQEYLTGLTGSAPCILAYPNGSYDTRSIAAAERVGVRLAVTVGRGKTRLPLAPRAALTIERAFIACGTGLTAACARARSDVQLRRWLERRTRAAA